MPRNNFGFNADRQFHTTCWFLLLENCMLLSDRPAYDQDQRDWWISSDAQIFGIIDFRRGYLMDASVSHESTFCRITVVWMGLDKLEYRIVLAPCELHHAVSICKNWVKTLKQTWFVSGVHNWPILITREEVRTGFVGDD